MGLGMMMVSVETMVTAVAATWPEAEKHMQTTLLGGDGKAEEPRTAQKGLAMSLRQALHGSAGNGQGQFWVQAKIGSEGLVPPDQRQQDSHLLQVTMVPAGSDANQAAHPVLGH